MSYFVCFKTTDSAHQDFYLLTYEDESLSVIMDMAKSMTKLLCINSELTTMPIIQVIDNHYHKDSMAVAASRMSLGEINDFEWKFTDRYGRIVRCYITSNI